MELKAGYKMTEVGVIPVDWEVNSLGNEINDLLAGVSVNSVNEEIDIAHDFAVLKTSCVFKGVFYPGQAKKITNSDLGRAKLNPKKGHIIISRMNTPDLVGECGYVMADFPKLFLPDRLWMMVFKKLSLVNPIWLTYVLNYPEFRQKIREMGSGTSGSMKNISKKKLLQLLIPYPNEAEQTAIATALSDADALISSLEKLIAKKRNIKQGAMQKLLQPKEGWKVKRLGEIFTFYPTANYSKAEMAHDGEIGCMHYGLVHAIANTNYSLDHGVKYYVTGNKSEYELIKDGDVIMVDASEDLLGINKSVEIFGVGNKKFIAGLHTYLMRDKNSVLVNNFRGLILNSNVIKNQLLKWAVGMKVFGVSKFQLKEILIPIPPIIEQTNITSILSDIDEEISALESKLKKYRNIKLGMMQNLLTGKIRLV